MTPRPMPRALAVFDFDGTLTDRHTLWRYLRFLAGPRPFAQALVELAPAIRRVATGSLDVMAARDLLFQRLLAGLSARDEERAARRFAIEHTLSWLRPLALARLRVHRQAGHTLAIVSNSAESYLRYVGIALSIEHVLGTRFEVERGRLTGRVLGASCVGAEKVARLEAQFGDLGRAELHAYGDSAGDRELLAIADIPHFRPFRSAPFRV